MQSDAIAPNDGRAQGFLARLADPSVGAIPSGRTALVVAHPDDETIGIGGQLARLSGITVVHATDGAPRGEGAAEAHGFSSPDAYAARRRDELRAAMALADVPPAALVTLDIPDQQASLCLTEMTHRLASVFRERDIDLVLTHAFEGGHPDHDATALAVHAAAALLGLSGQAPAIVEMPLYHLGLSGWTVQRFIEASGGPEIEIRLDAEQRRRKQAMLDAHVTQRQVLSIVAADLERFRPAPAYDFTVLPNQGRLLYDLYGWGMTGARWQSLATAALQELGIRAVL